MALTSRQKMGAAALIMAFSVLVSRFMGLFRDKIISWQFGAGGEADIYFAAFVVPDFLNYLLAGGYVSITLIPLLSRRFEEDEADGWRFFGTVFCWATLSIGVLSVLAWIAAPELAPLVAPGFNAAQCERLSSFLRIVLPAQVFFLPGACLSAILYIRHQFAVPALMPLLYNGCILLFGVGLPYLGLVQGMEGFCWGVLAGAAVGAFLLPLVTVRAGGLSFVPGLVHPLMKKFLLMALPLMIGQSVVVLDEQFVRIFGSLAGEGAVSLLNYARRIMMVPVGVVAQAAGVASFPFLASLAAHGNMEEFRSTLGRTMRNSMIVAIPVTAWMITASGPVLGFIFEGGSFSVSHTAGAAPLLQIMMLAVPFWLLQQVTGRAFYAVQDTLTPAVVGTVATLLAVPGYLVFIPLMGARGVALVTTVCVAAYALVLLFIAERRFARGAFAGIWGTAWRNALMSMPGCGIMLAVMHDGFHLLSGLHPLLQQFLVLLVGGLLFVGSWLVLSWFFHRDYFYVVASPFLRRMRRAGQR
ncbi:murein biosynthesis integral membrane protein MurJ [uncultured Mailhella sp.]|uniref:murein biosynthesis integral membrane protein MurJ n=1 Tax=uncultured Mailhella sp. TaxID=1981031 RepID=UPI0025F2F916|nr:murein biosynthesis integral membrane protein MurJ [uncultured Mailhella sp.]